MAAQETFDYLPKFNQLLGKQNHSSGVTQLLLERFGGKYRGNLMRNTEKEAEKENQA